jgi:electron-transferring-flavoprotein dehydrogenase
VGGILSLPKTVFPGGALVGDDAGYLNASRIKGSHAAIKTGMLAARAAFDAVQAGRQHDELTAYPEAFEKSWLYTELNKARNFKQWFKKGRTVATFMTGIEQFVLRGSIPWTLHRERPDHTYLKPAAECTPIVYPKPDGKLTFDRLSSVFISNTNHAEDQPAHLTLKDATVPVNINLSKFAGPESRYCPPAFMIPVKEASGNERLQINAQNRTARPATRPDAEHRVVTPEGGGGPNSPT